MASQALKKFVPLFDRVLVRRMVAETTTKVCSCCFGTAVYICLQGGIHIPEKAQGKMNQGTVVAVGQGALLDDGKTRPCSVAVGDNVSFSLCLGKRYRIAFQVLLPEYGGTKVEFDKEELFIFRDTDFLGKFSQ